MSTNGKRTPGGEITSRPLHFFWIIDTSGSMCSDGKIQATNTGVREALPHLKKFEDSNPFAQILMRALSFSNGAQWVVSQPTPVKNFKWTDLHASGCTDMGKALSTVAEHLKIPPMSNREFPPVLLLISDGQPTDDFQGGLNELMSQTWGKKAIRMAIAIGRDANHDVLQQFIGNPEFHPLQANNPEALIKQIVLASVEGTRGASSPPSQPTTAGGNALSNVNLTLPVAPSAQSISATDVW